MENIEKELKQAISNVNDSLMIYENGFCSLRRYEDDDYESKERCKSFEQFIELRFNFELSKLSSFKKLQNSTEGHLFRCLSVDNVDEKRRKYKMAHLELLDPSIVETEIENLKEDIENLKILLGGTKISFNNVQKKIKLIIE